MPQCPVCEKEVRFLSRSVGECYECAVSRPDRTESNLTSHRETREPFGLPAYPPRNKGGTVCTGCGSRCVITKGEPGFCGLKKANADGTISHAGKAGEGVYEWYFDPLPTNCVADWVCAGGTGAGFPDYSYRDGPEHGYFNLAVFMGACSLNCLFCQNASYKNLAQRKRPSHSPDHIPSILREDTACICYFGGDPTPQMDFIIEASQRAFENRKSRILRICLETNGFLSIEHLKRIAPLVLTSGGCLKFDLKAWSDNLYVKLTGQKKAPSFRAFEEAASNIPERPEPPPVVASTLLVPGYVEAEEVGKIARFIASLDPNIPYSLLAFYPRHAMKDLPRTPRKLAMDALKAARDAGLSRVRIGNAHLLW